MTKFTSLDDKLKAVAAIDAAVPLPSHGRPTRVVRHASARLSPRAAGDNLVRASQVVMQVLLTSMRNHLKPFVQINW